MSDSLIAAVYRGLFKIWRRKRHQQFLDIVRPVPGNTGDRLLDVGGYPAFWQGFAPVAHRVDCLNTHPVPWEASPEVPQPISTLVGDGCAMKEIADQSYDVVFSNSVIEHVGDQAKQRAFAEEVRRVGRKLWVQTPAYECPLEPHYLAPFVHYLPKTAQRLVLRWLTPWGWIARPTRAQVDEAVESIRLLTKREFASLFPDCQILTERTLFVIPKSYIAVRV